MKIVSLLPAATEIVAELGLLENLVGVSHECDTPHEVNALPRVTRCPIHDSKLSSAEIDRWVRETLHRTGTLYTIDEPLLRELAPDLILTQKLCDVCAVNYGSVAKLAATLSGAPQVVNLEPETLEEVWDDIRRVARAAGVAAKGEAAVARLEARVEKVAAKTRDLTHRPRCFLMEWADPPFCAGHWNPQLVELAGGREVLGEAGFRSRRVGWHVVCEEAPEFVIVSLCGWDLERARGELPLLRALPGWDELPAVRNGQVFLMNGNALFSRPGPCLAQSLEVLAGALHPDLFPEFAPEKWPVGTIERAVL